MIGADKPASDPAATGEDEGETALTVEAALTELRELFPFGVRGIEFWTVEDVERPRVDIRWDNKTIVRSATLAEAMQKVRELHATQNEDAHEQ